MDSSLSFRFCATATFFTLLVNISIKLYRKFGVHQEDRITDTSSSSLSYHVSSLSQNWKYHVFPSFHGADVRKTFLSHIQKEFSRKGIDPFIDNNIERGKSIGPELVEAIRGSKIAIVLFSKNYASSSWCLNELVEIMKCREELGQTVMTVFYEVDPTDIKKKTGGFGTAFTETCKGKTKEEIMRWKKALDGAATIAGEHSRNWDNEAAMIEKITTDVSNMLNNSTQSRDFDNLVGMGAHIENMRSLLRLDLDEVRMVGILGPSGIGKTTIARYLFNQVSSSFQLSTIMVNIKGCYPRPCLDEYSTQLQLQQKMLSQMINQKDIMIPHLGVAQERLKNKKVFLVLDDVDRLGQLVALAKEIWWFGPGSRIIITTEDIRVLNAHGISNIYRVDYPSIDEAFQIFCMYAFGQKQPYDGFFGLAREAMELAGELPLGLKVLGSSLRGMTSQEWVMALPRLNTCLDGEIENVLRFSYDALCDEDKDLFLYIACFFNYGNRTKVENHLAKRFLDVRQGIHVLAEKSLIDIRTGEIEMHNLLVQLGREIARKQYSVDPKKLYFMVDQRDICQALSYDTIDSSRVIGMDFNLNWITNEVNISEKALERMSNLQFLRFKGSKYANTSILYAMRSLNYRYTKIRYLHWKYCPMTCLPSTLNPKFLIELNMRYSELHKLWEGNKPLKNLKWMDLSYSKNLKELPGLSTATNLEDLILKKCSSLVELHTSIGELRNLKSLCLSGCSSLLELHSFHENVIDLKIIDLSDCSSLINLPSSIGNAINLQKLSLQRCSRLVELPDSIENLTNLKELNLSGCSRLVELPSSIGNLTSLEELDLNACSCLVELHSSIGNLTHLEKLNLSGCSKLVELSFSFENLTHLETLNLSGCSSLAKLTSLGNATNFKILNLRDCSNLVEISSIGNAANLQLLNLDNCSSLVNIPFSIRNSTKLSLFHLNNCSSIVELPSIENATSLLKMELNNCSSLLEFPNFIGPMNNLQEFSLYNCSSLVELPSSVGNLRRLHTLRVVGCKKLEILPDNINLESLDILDLTDCSQLKRFPEISTNIKDLHLVGTAIEEVPSSIRSWSRLNYLSMQYFGNLKEFPHVFDIITELHISEDVQEVTPWVQEISRLRRIVLNNCKKLVSLPQLPDSLSQLDAENCDSLERLDCSFNNPEIRLNFTNCFMLNNEARELIMQTQHVILPGRQVPSFFNHRATRIYLTVNLNQKPLRTPLRFKACIMLDMVNDKACEFKNSLTVYIYISGLSDPGKPRRHEIHPVLAEHLYLFQVEVAEEEVNPTELCFEFVTNSGKWGIRECGVFQIVEVPS